MQNVQKYRQNYNEYPSGRLLFHSRNALKAAHHSSTTEQWVPLEQQGLNTLLKGTLVLLKSALEHWLFTSPTH